MGTSSDYTCHVRAAVGARVAAVHFGECTTACWSLVAVLQALAAATGAARRPTPSLRAWMLPTLAASSRCPCC